MFFITYGHPNGQNVSAEDIGQHDGVLHRRKSGEWWAFYPNCLIGGPAKKDIRQLAEEELIGNVRGSYGSVSSGEDAPAIPQRFKSPGLIASEERSKSLPPMWYEREGA